MDVGCRELEGGCGSLRVVGLDHKRRVVVGRLCRRNCCCCFVVVGVDCSCFAVAVVVGLGCSAGAGIDYIGHSEVIGCGCSRCSFAIVVVEALGWRNRMRLVVLEIGSRLVCLHRHIDHLVSCFGLEEVVVRVCCSCWMDLVVAVVRRCLDSNEASGLLVQVQRV